jgi:CBS domain containing-hemolysin-like protein
LLPLMRRNRQPMAFVRTKTAEVIGIVTEANILGLLTVNLQKS